MADLRATLPPQLRRVTLHVPNSFVIANLQLLIDALSAAPTLETLELFPQNPDSVDSSRTAKMSMGQLLKLPQLSKLHWNIGDRVRPQLAVIKQLRSLRVLSINNGRCSAEQLAFLCQPPHRLDQLEMINLIRTEIGVAHMLVLAQLPRITHLDFVQSLQLDAFRMLPRLPSLQRLGIKT